MRKTYFTRKTLVALSFAFLYSFVFLFTGYCLTANKNVILKLAQAILHFQPITSGATFIFIFLILVALYVVVGVAAILYERRFAIVNGKKPYSFKMIMFYILTVMACVALSFGVATLIVKIANVDILEAYRFIGQTLLISLIIYLLVVAALVGVLLFVVNFILIDKPFRFFKEEDMPVIQDEEELEENDVTSNFDKKATSSSMGASEGMLSEMGVRKVEALDDREKVFPALSSMDEEYDGYAVEEFESDDVALDELCVNFRNYLAQKHGLYYEAEAIRFWISGLATSHFSILEGLSGTGKSSLPRYFAEFVGAQLLFVPVQATWRDKTSLIGYFNDFSKTYTETEFLLGLYHGNYNPDMIHIYVLDEMNISRIEYYFADFLSVLEYPVEDWKLKIMQLPFGFIPPAKLMEGVLQIQENSYFVGTANKDDSTFTITDKVYDRAITIDFEERNEPFSVKGEVKPIKLSQSKLKGLFDEAKQVESARMSAADFAKLYKVTDFISEQFDIIFGNRIQHQIEELVPVYVACGGKKEEALDLLISRKVISKIEGRFEEYVKGALKELLALISATYGTGVLVRCEKTINSIMRRL